MARALQSAHGAILPFFPVALHNGLIHLVVEEPVKCVVRPVVVERLPRFVRGRHGTAIAAANLVSKLSAEVVGCTFIIDLPDLGGSNRLKELGYECSSLISFEGL